MEDEPVDLGDDGRTPDDRRSETDTADADSGGRTRRRLLLAGGSVSLLGFAGCVGSETNYGNTDFDSLESYPDSETSDGDIEYVDLEAPVPEDERNCVSVGGHERNPDDLQPKDDVTYRTAPQGHQLCANCEYYCRVVYDGGAGACTEVAGRISSRHWCALWSPASHAEDPVWQAVDDEASWE